MKTVYESVVVAFGMYTKIPMPVINWNDRNMRYSFLVLPIVGLVIAALLYGLLELFHLYSLAPVLFAALATAIPVMITGGLHLDGFCDTTDALASHKTQEQRLQILKDPHVGSFAVVNCMLILLLQFGAWVQIYQDRSFACLVLGAFVLSRILISLAVVTFPCAKTSGLASIFSGYASKTIVSGGLLVYLILSLALLVMWHLIIGAIVVFGTLVSFGWFFRMSKKHFGGVTGDLAGFYLVLYETGALLTVAIIGGMLK